MGGSGRTRFCISLLAASLLVCALPAAHGRALPQDAGLPSAPSAAPVSVDQTRALAEQGRLPEAESAVRRSIAQDETSAPSHYLLAYILLKEDKPAPSLAEYTHAARLQIPTAQQLEYVAFDYVLLNDYSDADKWMTQATARAPDDSEAWYSLGRIKYNENRFAESIDCFKKALVLTPGLVKAEDNLGLALEGLDQTSQAIGAYQTAIAWQSGAAHPSEQPLLNLGLLFLEQNRTGEAEPLLEQAETISPNDPKIRAALGRLYQRLGRLHDAQIELERAVALAPKEAAYHFQLGRVYHQMGSLAKAKAQFAETAALDGTHSSN